MIYTNSNFANNYLNSTVANRDVWIAQWYPADPHTNQPNIGVFNSWAFWQWTDMCSIPGIGSAVDCDVFNGTVADLQDFVIGGGEPPIITGHPSNQVIDKGQTANFTVSAGGSNPLSYQWQKNGSDLIESGTVVGTQTTILQLSNCWNGDEGDFRCVVTNNLGSATSNAAMLTVITPPPDFDGDGDVDLADHGHMQACLTGSSIPVTDPNCTDAKLDGDGDADLTDAAIFLGCLSGADVQVDDACAE
jgi:hypothetical protein